MSTENTFVVSTSYQMGGHDTLERQDAGFYHSLPNYNETFSDVPRPDVFSLVSVVGSAVLSSTVLATAIKTWLQSRRTKITITTSRSQVSFEGPNLKDSVQEIQAILEAMEDTETNKQELKVLAERMDVPMVTSSQWQNQQDYVMGRPLRGPERP